MSAVWYWTSTSVRRRWRAYVSVAVLLALLGGVTLASFFRPLAVALGVFGALAAVATVLLVGQALVRLVRSEREDLATLRAMGAGPRLVSWITIPGALACIGAGVVGAAGVAAALSPLAPIGPLRKVEPEPGVALDWLVLALGAGALAVVLGLLAVTAAVRQAPHRRQARGRIESARRSALAGALSAAGMPLPAVVGMRLALESGAGRTAVPARAALGGAVVAVVALVALAGLRNQPRVAGRRTAALRMGLGPHRDGRGGLREHRRRQGQGVAGRRPGGGGVVGRVLPVGRPRGDRRPGPRRRGESGRQPPIAVGPSAPKPGRGDLGDAHPRGTGKRIGDTIVLRSDEEDQSFRVVGTAVFPTVGPILGAYTSLGRGAMMIHHRIPGWDQISPEPKALFVRLAAGSDHAAATKHIAAGVGEVGLFPGSARLHPVQRPAEIVNYGSMGATPAVLAAVLVLAAVVSLGLTLVSGVHRRRRDLSILKALGLTRRQLSATVVWQSSIIVVIGLLAGVPLGIGLGRWLWILFAERLPVLAQPAVPALVLTAVACGLLVLANLVAAVPARLAGRTPVAAILRSE